MLPHIKQAVAASGSTVGYPSDSLASCHYEVTVLTFSDFMTSYQSRTCCDEVYNLASCVYVCVQSPLLAPAAVSSHHDKPAIVG